MRFNPLIVPCFVLYMLILVFSLTAITIIINCAHCAQGTMVVDWFHEILSRGLNSCSAGTECHVHTQHLLSRCSYVTTSDSWGSAYVTIIIVTCFHILMVNIKGIITDTQRAWLHVPVSLHYNSILFQPSISVGNVGQLTVDLLINTLKLPRVGYLKDPALLPLVGNDAFDHTHPSGYLHTSAEGVSLFVDQLDTISSTSGLFPQCLPAKNYSWLWYSWEHPLLR